MMLNKFKKILVLLFVLAHSGCGTGIGNGIFGDPTTSSASGNTQEHLDFSPPIDEYDASTFDDCGSFTENSSVAAVDAGRDCIREAFDTCTESKYLLDKHNSDGTRFVSFVSVEITGSAQCQLRVHTVSNVLPDVIGDVEKSCTELEPTEYIETACGVGK